MKYEITVGGTLRVMDIESAGEGRYRVRWADEEHVVDVLRPSSEAWQMLIDGESWEAGCVATEEGFLVDVVGTSFEVAVVDPRRKPLRLGTSAAQGILATQMPGRVTRVLVAPGDAVRKGQPLLMVEAMKMENEMKCPMDGVVTEVMVTAGQSVETGTRLVRIGSAS